MYAVVVGTSLLVYNGEIHYRPQWRWIVMGGTFLTLCVSTLFSTYLFSGESFWIPWWTDVLSALLLLALGVWYIIYVHKAVERQILIRIEDDWLRINERLFQRHAVHWFHIITKHHEKEPDTLVLMLNTSQEPYSLATNTKEQLMTFLHALESRVSYVPSIQQSFLQKALRRLKL